MADFRKMLYALAVVALLAAFTVPASAQGLNCTQPTGTNAAIRQGGFTELAGDFVVACDAEIPGVVTPAGTAVKQGTLRVKVIGTTFTSKIVSSGSGLPTFTESLLLIDNPDPVARLSATPAYYGQLPCGTNTNDNSINGPGVCNIISTGNPGQTYDGIPTANNAGACAGGYGCGRPNIYQGRISADQATCPAATCVEFLAVPLDPPGTNSRRIFRFVNNRVNAAALGIGSNVTFEAAVVNSQTSFSLPLVKQATVGEVVASAPTTSFASNSGYVLCAIVRNGAGGTVTINEVTSSTWRARNTIVQRVNNSDYAGNQFVNYNGGTSIPATDDPQNVPLGGYFTESGFVFGAISGGTALGNGLGSAGVATQGTQLSFPVSAVPTGVTVTWPPTVPLTNGSNTTGFMNLVSASGGVVTYEVGFTNPFLVETAAITPTITYFGVIPGPSSMSAGSAILAPYGSSVSSNPGSFPRFAGSLGATNNTLFDIGSCTCNLLFPWVVSSGEYSTGIVVSNTSKDPTNAGLSPTTAFTAVQEAGVVSLYLFGTNTAGTTTVAAAAAGSPSANTPAGTSATFVVGGVSGGFKGYAIAQAEFQYCHGGGFIFSTIPNIPTMSYLGLVMDRGFVPLRRTTNFQSDNLDQ